VPQQPPKGKYNGKAMSKSKYKHLVFNENRKSNLGASESKYSCTLEYDIS
jgi:hypothetical protein